MSELGVDRAGAISVAEARILKDLHGVSWCGCYLGGPRNGGYGWTRSVLDGLGEAVGWRFLPIYVGRNLPWDAPAALNVAIGQADAEDCLKILAGYGWPAGQNVPVCLDVEYDTVQVPWLDYGVRWANVIRDGGYYPVIYAPPGALNDYGRVSQGATGCWATWWYADGRLRPGLSTGSVPGLRAFTGANERAWQYTGGTYLNGLSGDFDLNASDLNLAKHPGAYVGQPAGAADPNALFVPETGYWVVNIDGAPMLDAWQAKGGVAVCGYPLGGMVRRDDGVYEQLMENVIIGIQPDGTVRFEGLGQRYRQLLGVA